MLAIAPWQPLLLVNVPIAGRDHRHPSGMDPDELAEVHRDPVDIRSGAGDGDDGARAA